MKDSELTEKQRPKGAESAATCVPHVVGTAAKALFRLGVPAETIVQLNARCLCPTSLAGKEVFQSASSQMDEAAIQSAMAMNPPKLKL